MQKGLESSEQSLPQCHGRSDQKSHFEDNILHLDTYHKDHPPLPQKFTAMSRMNNHELESEGQEQHCPVSSPKELNTRMTTVGTGNDSEGLKQKMELQKREAPETPTKSQMELSRLRNAFIVTKNLRYMLKGREGALLMILTEENNSQSCTALARLAKDRCPLM